MAQTQRQVRRIEVIVDTKGTPGLKEMAAGFKSVNQNIKETTSVLTSFRNAFFALKGLSFAGMGIEGIVSMADNLQKLRDRINTVEGGVEAGARALRGLGDVARETSTGIEDLSVVYFRLAGSLKETGISTEGLLGLTQLLQNSFRLSGATAAEATAATIQLSQGLASGQVRGQELRSVLEQNVIVGELLSKQLGITRGELLKFSEKTGGIDFVTFLRAMANGADELNTKAKGLQPTIGEALTTAFNDLKVSLEAANRELGVSKAVVTSIQVISENSKDIAVGIGAIAAAWGVYTIAVNAATLSTRALEAALSSKILGWIVKIGVGIGSVVAAIGAAKLALAALAVALVAALVQLQPVQESFSKIGQVIKDVFQNSYKKEIQEQTDAIKTGGDKVHNASLMFNEYQQAITGTINHMRDGKGVVESYTDSFKKFAETAEAKKKAFDFDVELSKLNNEFLKDKNVDKYNQAVRNLQIQELDDKFSKGKLTLAQYNKELRELKFGKDNASLKEFRIDIGKLNAEFAAGRISLGQYTDSIEGAKIEKLSRDLKTGRADLMQYNEAMDAHRSRELNRSLQEGTATLQEWKLGIESINVEKLNRDLETGKTTIYEYNRAIVESSETFRPGSAAFVGLNDYMNAVGNVNQNVANGITTTFGHLENHLVEFTKTGKANFQKFAADVIEDINRIILRALIIRPIAEGILGALPGATSGQGNNPQASYSGAAERRAAKGAAFDGGAYNFFANGGVITGRTGFNYGQGKKGIMGEAGPEAILPLRRDRNGDLGVASGGSSSTVLINITNQGDSEVQQRESTGANGERVIDILIAQKVKEAFANGSMDKQMSQNYGLRRKGN